MKQIDKYRAIRAMTTEAKRYDQMAMESHDRDGEALGTKSARDIAERYRESARNMADEL